MATDDTLFFNGFVDSFNRVLTAANAQVRIALASDDRPAGRMRVLDIAGKSVGWLPDTIEPDDMFAVAELLAECYQRGIDDGKSGSARSFELRSRQPVSADHPLRA